MRIVLFIGVRPTDPTVLSTNYLEKQNCNTFSLTRYYMCMLYNSAYDYIPELAFVVFKQFEKLNTIKSLVKY